MKRYALPFNINYTGLRKAILDWAYASPNIDFLRPVNSVLDGKLSNNIWYMYVYIRVCMYKFIYV